MSRILGNQLTPQMITILNSGWVNGVLATVDEDGFARSAPIGTVRVVSPESVLIIMADNHQSTANLKRDRRVSISIVEREDQAFTFKGLAQLLKPLDCSPNILVFRVTILEIKLDNSPVGRVDEGIKISIRSEKAQAFYRNLNKELEELAVTKL